MARKKTKTKGKLPFQLKLRIQKRNESSEKRKTQTWRDKLKDQDPRKYKQVKEQEKRYSRIYRLNMATAEQILKKRTASEKEKEDAKMWLERKKKYNEGCRIRQKKYATNKKLQKEKEKEKPVTPLTRQKYEKNKLYGRDRKRDQRAGYSKARQEAVKARRRELYAIAGEKERNQLYQEQQKILKEEEKRLKEIAEKLREEEDRLNKKKEEIALVAEDLHEINDDLPEQSQVDMRSNSARRQSLHRVRSSLPRRPAHLASTLSDVVEKASPRTSKAIRTVGVAVDKPKRRLNLDEVVTEQVKKGLKCKRKRQLLGSTLSLMKKYKLQRQACKQFNVSAKLLRVNKKRQGRKSTPINLVKEVHTFYETNSTQLPDKKLVSKKSGKAVHVMDQPVGMLYKKYVKAHPKKHVKKSVFYSQRPKHVHTKRQAKYYGCLCEYCENIRLKLKPLASHLHAHNPQLATAVKDVYALAHFTLCKKPEGREFHKTECLERRCKDCGVKNLDALECGSGDKVVEWKCWDLIEQEYQSKKDKEVKIIKKRGLVSQTTPISILIQQLKKEANPFCKHLFQKDWQQKQFKELKSNLPQTSYLSILDFSENYKCSFQHEVQSAYYAQNSATLHPIVTFYHCPTCSKLVQESCIMISDDLKHDHHLVNTFQKSVAKHLQEKRNLHIETAYRFSDGCSSQYKSIGPFSDISYAAADLNCSIHHSYFGTRHGKGPSDGEGAVVKSQATQAVLCGSAVIGTAHDLYKFTKERLTKESEEGECCRMFRRTAFYIARGDVKRDDTRKHQMKSVKGTRDLHSVRTHGSSGGQLQTRNLSCFCSMCLKGGTCSNTMYVEKWKVVNLASGRKSDAGQHDDASPEATRPVNPPDPPVREPHVDSMHEDAGQHDDASPEDTRPVNPPDPPVREPHVDSMHENAGQHDDASPEATRPVNPPDPLEREPHLDNMYEVGDYVAVIYNNTWWAGQITETEGEMCSINFMVGKGNNKFMWPSKEEKDLIHKRGIFTKFLSAPIPVSTRYIGFDEQSYQTVKDNIHMYLQENEK